MVEVKFEDRIPTHPGRYKLMPVAGHADLFDFERADKPIENGTPLNKAAFDSIIHSRLTGRFYEPTVSRTLTSVTSGITVNPIPATGWVLFDNTRTILTNIGYKITTSSTQGQADPDRAIDDDSSSYWSSKEGTTHTFTLQLDEAITIKKIITRYIDEQFTYTPIVTISGSSNGEDWDTLWTQETNMQTKREIALTTTGLYSFYRISFVFTDNASINLYSLEISEYDINYYHNEFSIENELPKIFTTEQRLMLVIPENTVTMGVTSNSLNGIPINTILQPSRRYELRYTGSAFVVKEV